MIMSCLPSIFKRSPKAECEKQASRRPSLFSIKSNKSSKSRNSGTAGSYKNQRQSQIYELTDRRWYMYSITQPDGEVEKTMVALPPAVAERLNLGSRHETEESPSPRSSAVPIPSEPLASVLPPSPTMTHHERQKSTCTYLTISTHDRTYEDTITRIYDEDEVW